MDRKKEGRRREERDAGAVQSGARLGFQNLGGGAGGRASPASRPASKQTRKLSRGWRDGSAVKRWGQFPAYTHTHTHGGSQLSATPVPENLTPSFGLSGTRHAHDTHTYMKAKH